MDSNDLQPLVTAVADLRDFDEMERSFGAAVQLLDAALDGAYTALARRDIAVIDRSNRSGFDHSGFPNYLWAHDFRHKGALERCVNLQATTTWTEPVLANELPGAVAIGASVVVFRPGQSPPLFASTPFTRNLPLEACAGGGLLQIVLEGLHQAAASLPAEYRERVAGFR